jgi:hypothetical protein
MGLTLEQIVGRLEDPETPIVWLDPSLPEELWIGLPEAVAAHGYRALQLDEDAPISGMAALVDELSKAAGAPAPPDKTTASLRDCLVRLPREGKGWVIIFHCPESLRQNDEVAFEDFLEILELVHEARYESHQQVFKLIVRD